MTATNYTQSPKFFLGANTPNGFVSRFDNLYYPEEGWFAYIIKGGPGTGKSTLMKRLAKEANLKNVKTELIYCSSDPSSLDAVIFPELKKSELETTSHFWVLSKPKYEASSIISLILHLEALKTK